MVALIQEDYLQKLMNQKKSFSAALSYPKFLTSMLSEDSSEDQSQAAAG
jgi:hypothetical protein